MKIHFITLNSKSKLHHTHKVCCTCKLQYTHCFFWAKTAKRIFICFFIFHHCPKEWMYSVLLFLLLAWVDLGSKMEPCATKINSWKSLLLLEKALCLSLYVCISLCLSLIENSFLCTNWFCFNLMNFAGVLTCSFIKQIKNVTK